MAWLFRHLPTFVIIIKTFVGSKEINFVTNFPADYVSQCSQIDPGERMAGGRSLHFNKLEQSCHNKF